MKVFDWVKEDSWGRVVYGRLMKRLIREVGEGGSEKDKWCMQKCDGKG